ncbi:5-(carboxyamino)imidazole ribonucleotide mutase [Candidatus Bathyarchaeota archaeon]|nr:5-(carboxyamino)imidazole ribonucleotide mutase [Candidatus Bathyarchaeota archaeon]
MTPRKEQSKLVAVVMGSESDRPVAEEVTKTLDRFGIPYEVKTLSAHRNPKDLEEYIGSTGAVIFIAVAGLSAQLPGYISSRTSKPVIGVPVNVSLEGLDALLAMMQMPKGVPVATVGVGNGENAALLAARILAMVDPEIKSKLTEL